MYVSMYAEKPEGGGWGREVLALAISAPHGSFEGGISSTPADALTNVSCLEGVASLPPTLNAFNSKRKNPRGGRRVVGLLNSLAAEGRPPGPLLSAGWLENDGGTT